MIKMIFRTALTALLLLSAYSIAPAEELENSYDENTEITVKGRVREIEADMHGPVILRITSGNSVYSVATAPFWYLRMEKITFSTDEILEVRGSKYFSKGGRLYIIAKKIRSEKNSREIFLRDVQCRPMWHGMRSRQP